jgi:DNA polymerase III subunit delta'
MGEKAELCFTRLLGQERAKRLLRRSLATGRIPHAYLFRGPDGVGKALFARGLAAALDCAGQPPGRACGHCPSCRKFLAGSHPDYLVLRPDKGALKIDQIRRLTRELSYPPYQSQRRVVVVEDAHTMRREAANSLLKTLEEPPADNLLILTADGSREIMPTLLSRCQVIPFVPLSVVETTSILIQQGVAAAVAGPLARFAEGSPGRALLFQHQDMVSLSAEVTAMLSDPRHDPDREILPLLQLAEKMAALKEGLPPFLGLLKLWLRDQLLGEEVPGPLPGQDSLPTKSWSSSELFARLQAIAVAEEQLARNCNRALVSEVLLFALQ